MFRNIFGVEVIRFVKGVKSVPIPDFESIMLPLLKLVEDGKEHSAREALDYIIDSFNLNEEEKRELLDSGTQTIIYNRVGWARTYLKKAGLIESPRRGYFKITDRGIHILNKNPPEINTRYLSQFSEFIEFKFVKGVPELPQVEEYNKRTPQELLESGYQKIILDLSQELLTLVKECSSEFFEKLVVDVLVKMGYGGSRKDAGEAIGKIGDEGVDGIIKEDKLGLDVIYIQAKRWENTVGRPEIQKFAGALQGKRAKKGIFITTSDFSKQAKEFVSRIETKIVLIDGEQLAEFMIDHDVGVSTEASYTIKKIDSDYFPEE